MGVQTFYGWRTALSALAAALLSLPAKADVIKIVASEFKFQPSQVRATAGNPVTVVFDNSAAATEHQIFIPELGLHVDAKAGETVLTTIQFTEGGDFDFICDLPGHTEAGMRGKFIVDE